MADLLFVVITVAFFVLCVGYVKVCDRIIGPDPSPEEGGERELVSDGKGVRA